MLQSPILLEYYRIQELSRKDVSKMMHIFNESYQAQTLLNWSFPTYSENSVLSPKLWNSWNTDAKVEYERIVSGMIGDFENYSIKNLRSILSKKFKQ